MGRATRLLSYLAPYKTAFAAGFGAAVLASLLDGFSFALLIPFMRVLFDVGAVVPSTPTGVERVLTFLIGDMVSDLDTAATLRRLVILILLTVALKNAAGYVATYLSRHIEESVMRDLRRHLYQHIQQMGLRFFHDAKPGQLVTRMFSDTEQARVLVAQGLHSVIRNGVLIVVYLAILFSLSWRLGVISLLLAPAIALVMKPILIRVRTRFAHAIEDRGELAAVVSETVSGARLVKAHAAEPYELGRFAEVSGRLRDRRLSAERLAILASPLSETLGAGVFVLLLWVGAGWTLQGDGLRPELFIAFLAVTLRLLPPVKMLAQFPTLAEHALAGADRVFDILDRPPEDVDPPRAREFPGLDREITFSGVWFAYRPETWVLRDVNLTVPRGTVLALVGQSGAGKSTLVDLLPRFIDPTRGQVLLDGVPTVDYSRRSLRRTLSVVSQETVIFNDSVLANIAYGDPAADPARVEAAARAANAHDFILRLPAGYETRLGERGARLSGGERQRIAIARVLLRDPPIVILDEATSALDAESERLIQEAMERLLENRTVLVIAHRLTTVVRADTIAVLDQGRIVEQGRHTELARAGGLYQRLHELALTGEPALGTTGVADGLSP